MKTKLFNCDAALWIGPNDHPEMQPLWRICQESCDTVAFRSSIQAAIDSPPRRPVTHVLIAQTNRHDLSTKTLDPDNGSAQRFRMIYREAKMLLIRGSLVAPLVGLPSTDANINKHWTESISHLEAEHYLPAWFDEQQPILSLVDPLTIVASNLEDADSLMTSITLMAQKQDRSPPWMAWSRELSQSRSRGTGTILWDDSVATPTTPEAWCQRINQSPSSRHLWATGMANRDQRQTAIESGIAHVIEKPARLESLLSVLTSK